jgi:hypothetical protein
MTLCFTGTRRGVLDCACAARAAGAAVKGAAAIPIKNSRLFMPRAFVKELTHPQTDARRPSRLETRKPRADVVSDFVDRKALIMHLSRFQRDVLADASGGAVIIGKAIQIIAVPVVLHASAITGKFPKHLRHVSRRLICISRPAREKRRGRGLNVNDLTVL